MTHNGSETLSEPKAFRHEAIFYEGRSDFLARTLPFIRQGIAASEPTLIVLGADKIEALRDGLGADSHAVTFADMTVIGRNPARIIPVWREFVADHVAPGRTARGVGEPIWAARTPDELAECERHEALLNVVFDGAPAWQLACPYDVTTLAPAVLDVARRNHPFVMDGLGSVASPTFPGVNVLAEPPSERLPEPAEVMEILHFDSAGDLGRVRAAVAGFAEGAGLHEHRRQDLVIATSEIATNSVRHGGGTGTLRMWWTDDSVICEIGDRGRITDPLVGRMRPETEGSSGYGIWLVHQLCDLVQVRTSSEGSTVRLHVRRGAGT